jgi:hypothetical protein
VDRLPGQASVIGDTRDPHGLLAQHVAHLGELGAREACFAYYFACSIPAR